MKFAFTLLVLLLIGPAGPIPTAAAPGPEEYLRWPVGGQRVDADLQTWPLRKILESIARGTGWQVFVEPDVEQRVSVKFKALPPNEALKKLLGRLNFTVAPGTNGLTSIHVFLTSRASATQIIRPVEIGADRPKSLIPNELVVRIKPGTHIDVLARQLGARVTGLADALQTYRLEVPD